MLRSLHRLLLTALLAAAAPHAASAEDAPGSTEADASHHVHAPQTDMPQTAPGSGMAGTTTTVTGPSIKAFSLANQRMHSAMMSGFTGDTDVDFVKGMIAHHEGAIEMAKIELQFGTDPELRKLAAEIVAAQTREIGRMNAWLTAHGQPSPPSPPQ